MIQKSAKLWLKYSFYYNFISRRKYQSWNFPKYFYNGWGWMRQWKWQGHAEGGDIISCRYLEKFMFQQYYTMTIPNLQFKILLYIYTLQHNIFPVIRTRPPAEWRQMLRPNNAWIYRNVLSHLFFPIHLRRIVSGVSRQGRGLPPAI